MRYLVAIALGATLLASCGQQSTPAASAPVSQAAVTPVVDSEPAPAPVDMGPAYVNCRWRDGRTMHADDLQRMMRDLERKTCRR